MKIEITVTETKEEGLSGWVAARGRTTSFEGWMGLLQILDAAIRTKRTQGRSCS